MVSRYPCERFINPAPTTTTSPVWRHPKEKKECRVPITHPLGRGQNPNQQLSNFFHRHLVWWAKPRLRVPTELPCPQSSQADGCHPRPEPRAVIRLTLPQNPQGGLCGASLTVDAAVTATMAPTPLPPTRRSSVW